MTLTLVYPPAADNGIKKTAVCLRLEKKLNNVRLTQKQRYLDGEITLQQFKLFLKNWFRPRINLVNEQIVTLQEAAFNNTWNRPLNETFIVTDAGIRIEYPNSANNIFMRHFFLKRQNEKLRLIHNKWGDDYRNGDITEDQWKTFKERWWKPRNQLCAKETVKYRLLQREVSWSINLSNVFVEV